MREAIVLREREETEEALLAIRDCLSRIRLGTKSITIHEGRAVQRDVTEKKRFGG